MNEKSSVEKNREVDEILNILKHIKNKEADRQTRHERANTELKKDRIVITNSCTKESTGQKDGEY